jgi:hypothetical protein
MSAQQAAWDLSTSYDYGSAVNAVANCFVVCNAGIVGTAALPDTDELRSLFDSYLNHYCDVFANPHELRLNAIFSRDLAFVILGLATMYRATNAGSYRRQLAWFCNILLEFEVCCQDNGESRAPGFLMRMDSPRAAFVDCHSAALLALTQAVRYVDDPRLVETLERGLASYSVESLHRDCQLSMADRHRVHEYGGSARNPSYSERLLEFQSGSDSAVLRRAKEFTQPGVAVTRGPGLAESRGLGRPAPPNPVGVG